MATFKAEMTLFDHQGGRLYLNKQERDRFLTASSDEVREQRVFCHILHYTGCRISEALALQSDQILLDDRIIVFQTIKKRKFDAQGNPRPPEYRRVDVPDRLIDEIELVFDLQRHLRQVNSQPFTLFPMSRTTAWRLIKRVLNRAGVAGSQATPKGFRHGFGIAMAQAGMPLTELKNLMGHASTETTEIYLQFCGEDKRQLVLSAWGQES